MKGYLRTLQPPTAVQAVCRATLSSLPCVVVVSGPHLKVYRQENSRLELFQDFKLHGNLIHVAAYETMQGRDDLLVVVGEPGNVGIVHFTEGGISTTAQMDLLQTHRVRVTQPCFHYDQVSGLLAIHIHTERIQLVTTSRFGLTPDLLRLVEYHLVDHQIRSICVLNDSKLAIVAGTREGGLVSVYDWQAEALQSLYRGRDCEGAALRKLHSGLWLCFCAGKVLLFSMANQLLETIEPSFGPIQCVGSGGNEAILAVTQAKDLVILSLSQGFPSRTLLTGICADSVTQLDGEFVFLASTEGNSSLLHISADYNEAAITWELQSLAPVVSMHFHFTSADFNVLTASRTALGSAISTCKWGTRLSSEAEIEVGRAVKMWSIAACPLDTLLVLSFSDQTRTLLLTQTVLEETNLPGFRYSGPTVFVTKWEDVLVQVGKRDILMVLIGDWSCTSLAQEASDIILSSASSARLYTLTVEKTLSMRLIQSHLIQEITRKELPFEVSAMACTPSYLAVACFEGRFIYFLDPITLEPIWKEELGPNFAPRSLLFEDFNGAEMYLFCGLGDGYLLTYTVSQTGVTKISLQYIGNYLVGLVPFQCKSVNCLLLISDRPTVIHIREGKLRHTYLSCAELRLACAVTHPCHESGLAVVSVSELQLLSLSGIFDFGLDIDRKSLESVSLMEINGSRVYLVTGLGGIFYVKACDMQTEETWERRLSANNEPVCMLPCDYGLIICTQHGLTGQVTLFHPFATDPKVPKFQRFQQIPVSVCVYNSHTVIIAFQQALTLWVFSAQGELQLQEPKSRYTGSVIGCMDVGYNLIVVGDMVRDVGVYIYTPEGFERLGTAVPLCDIVAVKLHTPMEVLACDQSRNIFLLTLEDTNKGFKTLQIAGGVHIGDMLTCMQTFPSQTEAQTVLSSVLGGLYIYKSLSEEDWSLLSVLSSYLAVSGIPFFRHQEFRFPATRHLSVSPDCILDGDLLLSFLDCTKSQQLEILRLMETQVHTSIEELQLLITKLAYSH